MSNKEKQRAHSLVHAAVRKGIIVRPADCSKCGSTPPVIHGHHTDYSKPLDVVWLCSACHGIAHRSDPSLLSQQRKTPSLGVQIDREFWSDMLIAESRFGVKKTRIISESAALGFPVWLAQKQREAKAA